MDETTELDRLRVECRTLRVALADAYTTAAEVCEQLRLDHHQRYGGDSAWHAGHLSAFAKAADALRGMKWQS